MEHDSGNVFHMFAPKALKPLFPNFISSLLVSIDTDVNFSRSSA